jgi:hypothetical protein
LVGNSGELIVDHDCCHKCFTPEALGQATVEEHALHHVDDGVVELLSYSVVFQCVQGYLLVDDALLMQEPLELQSSVLTALV